MEVLQGWVKPVWPWGEAPPAQPPQDVEYIEVEEMVPQDSWSDFYSYLISGDAEDAKRDTALSHTSSISTADSDNVTESTSDPSFSKIMATLVSSNDSGNHESSEDEGHAVR